MQVQDLLEKLLAFAHGDQVEEVGHGLGVGDGGAAAQDQRIVVGAIGALDGNAGQIQHLQHVGVAALVAHGEPEDVEVAQRAARLPAEQREVVLAHGVGHVGQRREAAVAEVRGVVVDQFVQQPHRQVGHADLVGVGKAQGQARLGRVPVLLARVVLARQVLGGFGDAIE